MATKTWNGATAPFTTDADWTGGVRPGVGDTAVINAGTVFATGLLPVALTINLTSNAGNSPVLNLTDATIVARDTVNVSSAGPDSILAVAGTTINRGNITLSGNGPVISFPSGNTTASFTNEGGISAVGTASLISSFGTATFTNNGTISYRNAQTAAQADNIFANITGTGSIRLNGPIALTFSGLVGPGQTIVFEPGASALGFTSLGAFQGSIAGFSSNDDIAGTGPQWSTATFTPTVGGGGGTLALLANGAVVSSFKFVGNYTSLADFTLTKDTNVGAIARTDIKTRVAEVPGRVSFTDTITGVSGSDPAVAYVGPVSYLQYEYIWNSTDDVVIGANVNNVFLHGGTGTDALVAIGGSNVLDGGGGSNFLVGATGSDGGNDTFFLDERGGQETWSTVLNFHRGDAISVFGWRGGVSTLPLSDDGTPGFTGATIHSEINGAGTGVNGSITLAGISVANATSLLNFDTSNPGLLYITYK